MGRVPTAFASTAPLARRRRSARSAARTPRPSALAAPLELNAGAGGQGRRSGSACTPSATCSSTCPRDRREARTIAELGPDETATVVVEVRSITSRPVRRRGMKPLVEATVADADRRR